MQVLKEYILNKRPLLIAQKKKKKMYKNKYLVSRILGVDSYSSISEHGLRSGSGHNQILT